MPVRADEDMERLYDCIYIIPTGLKHESGWMKIAIVGCWVEETKEKYEICASYAGADDLNWLLPDSKRNGYKLADLHTDCLYPEGVLRFWGYGKFKVGWGSSTDIEFIPDLKN